MKEDQLFEFAQRCDEAITNGDDQAIEALLDVLQTSLSDADNGDQAKLHYYAGNLFSARSFVAAEKADGWRNGDFPEARSKAIDHFRECLQIADQSEELLRNEATTNLGNELASQGRGVEALGYWNLDFTLEGDTPFVSSMMRSRELISISRWINDPSHQKLFVYEAYRSARLLRERIEPQSHRAAAYHVKDDPQILDLLKVGDADFHVLDGWQKDSADPKGNRDEIKYRTWCLKRQLFANPLSLLTDQPIANRDILQFPNHVAGVADGPFFSAAFSSAKREYCFARFLAFEGIHGLHPDYENQDLYLADTLDFVFLDGATEKLKTSWRVCFGVLDSIASLLNRYFGAGAKKVEFKSRWIKDNFANTANPFLDALYWLACDLTESELIAPEKWKAPTAGLSEIRKYRNSIEHGWLRVSLERETIWNGESDFADQISPDDLRRLVLLTLKTVNAALLYVTLAVKFHEENRAKIDGAVVKSEIPIVHDPEAMRSVFSEGQED